MNRRLYTFAVVLSGVLASSCPNAIAQTVNEEARVLKFSEASLSPPQVTAANCTASETTAANAQLSLSAAEVAQSKAVHGRWGLPQPIGSVDHEALVANRDYVVNYDSDLFVPMWASYELKKDHVVSRSRKNCFRPDPRIATAESATLSDYAEPVFDRGHIVPRADLNRTKEAMINTFVLSNMAPQHDNFNQGVWERLESFVRGWAVDRERIHVTTGAVFDADNNGNRDNDAAVPRVKPMRLGIATHFYKVILHEKPNGDIESLAILLPHGDGLAKDAPFNVMRQHLKDHIVSIDMIEQNAGYDLFPDMPAANESAVEAFVASDLWPVP